MVSPFDLSQTLLVGGGLLVPCSLRGPAVLKQLMQIVWCLARVGGFNQCASPNKTTFTDMRGEDLNISFFVGETQFNPQ